MIVRDRAVTISEFERGTGWQLRAEGACRGEVCVPLRDPVDGTIDEVDVESIAEQMGLPLVHDVDHDLRAVGPWSGTGRALVSADAPDLVLPDLDGNHVALSAFRGQKVLILSWAPY